MDSLANFKFEGQEVRVITRESEPWFVAKDLCAVLDIKNSRDALSRLDEDEKNTVVLTDGNRGNPNMAIVSESGMYALVLSSRKPSAKSFRKWVTSEVLPAIRKTGTYSVTNAPTPATQAELLAAIAQQMVEQERRISEQERQMAEILKELNGFGHQKIGKDGKMQPMVHGIAGISLALGSNIQDLNRLDYQVQKLEEAVSELQVGKPSLPFTPTISLKSASESRQTIREMVNNFACKTGAQQMELWRRLYKELYRRCGVCLTQGKEDSQTRLHAVSELGMLDTLCVIASEILA